MTDLLRELESRVDLVLIDAPPLLPVTDAAVLSVIASGSVLVVRHGRTRREQVSTAIESLRRVDAHLFGVILNMAPTKGPDAYRYGYGYGYGYSPWYDDYGYSSSSYPAYSYPVYQPSPNVNVVYAPPAQAQAPTTVYVERPNSLTREYDQYGQQSNRPMAATDSASPLYLIAFRDHTIRAAAAYWVEGDTLHYITQEHEQKQAALGTVDRDLSGQLNRERRVAFSLPASH